MKLNFIENRQATNLVNNTLKLFTQPEILEQIGRTRLSMFLTAFTGELNTAGIDLPLVDEGASLCFSTVAGIFADAHSLPQRLYTAVLTLEAAASPQNDARLDQTIHRRLPCTSLNRNCPLDCALELWFACPDELPQFAPPLSNSQTPQPPNSEQSTDPSTQQSNGTALTAPPDAPTHQPSDAHTLLDDLASTLSRYVVLPPHASDTLALWIVHTYAFELRDVSVYIGIESPEKRCGKTTLLTVLSELAHHAITAANISPSAFFHVIERERPTLLIDEADTFLNANEPLRGILNSGYKKKTAYVLRTVPISKADTDADPEPSAAEDASSPPLELRTKSRWKTNSSDGERRRHNHQSTNPSIQQSTSTARYSTWCPKAIATIDRLPETLADRCILIRMQRKIEGEQCERLRNLDAKQLQDRCAQFVLKHSDQIANATPALPVGLSDRAAEIWEPLILLADIAGGDWPGRARQAALGLSASAHQTNPIGSLLLDIFISFVLTDSDRMLTRDLIERLNHMGDRPWKDIRNGDAISDRWLGQQLRPYGVKPRLLRIGDNVGRGYLKSDLAETFRRYIPKSELDALRDITPPESALEAKPCNAHVTVP